MGCYELKVTVIATHYQHAQDLLKALSPGSTGLDGYSERDRALRLALFLFGSESLIHERLREYAGGFN